VRQLVLPPLTKALTAIEPFDIRDLSPASAASRSIHKLASNLGIKPVAACYPLLSRNGRAAFLVIQADMREADWRQLRRQHDRDIGALAMRFHAKLLAGKTPEDGIRHTIDRLTRREIETLSWIAAGKSYWEIAVILGITERTVRFFMSNARRKLNVVTNAQAVAEALWQDLIIHPHETHARI
jgi:LuxR family quorum-sensing system transcriptional regulator SinR